MMRRFAEASNAVARLACEGGGENGDKEALWGFCIVHIDAIGEGLAGYVVTLDVSPEHRSKGIATNLMRRAEADAARAGARAMMLHVYVGNDAALRLYERLGYGYLRTARGFYGRGIDALVYGKTLSGEQGAENEVGGEQRVV